MALSTIRSVRVGHLQGCVITLPDLLRGEAMPRPFLLRYFKLLAHLSCSEKWRERAEITGLVPHTSGNDGRMHTNALRESNYSRIARMRCQARGRPQVSRDQCLLGPLVGLVLARVFVARWSFAKAEIIDECLGRTVEVAPDVGEFVEE